MLIISNHYLNFHVFLSVVTHGSPSFQVHFVGSEVGEWRLHGLVLERCFAFLCESLRVLTRITALSACTKDQVVQVNLLVATVAVGFPSLDLRDS